MMQKTLLTMLAAAALCTMGCIKDTLRTTHTITIATPVLASAEAVRAGIGNKPPQPLEAPGKLFVQGHYLYVVEPLEGLHIINNSNPAAPVNEAFVAVPGIGDVAVQGALLYVDCFDDLLVLNIDNPKAVQLANFTEGVFPDRRHLLGYTMDSNMVIVGWNYRDSTIKSSREIGRDVTYINGGFWADNMGAFQNTLRSNAAAASAPAGKGGSMARFALSHGFLYTVSHTDLRAFSLQVPAQPSLRSITSLGWGIETIYPFQDKLFIGSNTGMFIYTLGDPAKPQKAGAFDHARVCDPVIADDDYAYVTLRSGTNCWGQINQLNVVDIINIYSPRLVGVLNLTNPHGLDKVGNYLYVCDGRDGLRVLDASDPMATRPLSRYALRDAYDVICWNQVAIVSAADGIHQYDIGQAPTLQKLSHITAQAR